MAVYGLKIYALDDATTNVAGIIEQFKSGEQWDWHGSSNPTFRINAGAGSVATTVSDTDASPLTLDDHEGSTFSQALASDTIIGATTYTAGSVIENEYELNLVDSQGNSYRFVAISINDTIVGFTFDGPEPPQGETLSYSPNNSFDNQSMVPCYAPGTLIDTPNGPCRIEALKVGDLVNTLDRGPQAVRWIHAGDQPLERIEISARPVLISAGALGEGRPVQDLIVSPQHRILVGGKGQLQDWFASECFVPAKSLTGLPGIRHMNGKKSITWIHFACDRHEVVRANGCMSESLLIGRMMLTGQPRLVRQELTSIYLDTPRQDGTLNGPIARDCLTVGQVLRHLSRHKKTRAQWISAEIEKWDIDLQMERDGATNIRDVAI